MDPRSSLRFWLEAAVAATAAVMAAVTLVSRGWLEAVFGVDPDGRSGAFEWWVVIALAGASLASARLARREHRRLAAAR